MSKSSPLFSKLLDTSAHHAYLVVGDVESNYEELRLAIREKVSSGKFEAADIWSRKYENVGIDDAREIKEVQNTKPVGKRRVMLVSLSAIQNEAQNSLLKLFEEPSSDTVFLICVRSTSIFLPTLLSRFYIVETKDGDAIESNTSITKFLSGTITERLAILEPIIKEKDKAEAENFLNSLELALHKKYPASFESADMYEDIFAARRFLRGRSPSVKMILEHISGIVPFVSKVTKS